MEKREIDISKIKGQILKSKTKIAYLKTMLSNTDDENEYDKIDINLRAEERILAKLNSNLVDEINLDKKEKATYKKALTAVKATMNDFYKKSKNNTKIKKHIQEINDIILKIDKYLG